MTLTTLYSSVMDFLSVNFIAITALLYATIIGSEVISKVPTVLHTPLMSGANAISGVSVIGGIILARLSGPGDWIPLILGALAIFFGMINVVGGFAVTNRMLLKFKKSDAKGGTK